uniref:Uncharacterized protein n=1 Tax=Meloidogyne enterolobii TaxID=390850 RepID=A0A6V7TK12_MELEN|nr:unnamed protein product [Meloidogyne enterolobii]
MSCFLPNGTKRPILDVNSEYLVYLWNFPNHLPMQNIRKDVFRRYGFVRFIETFEAWKDRRIGQIILEFADQKEMNDFIEAFERKEVLNNFDPPIEFIYLQKMGKEKFFDYVREWSGVDLLSCRGIPPSFDRKSRNPSTSFSSSRFPSNNNGIYKHIDDQKTQRNSPNIFSRVRVEKENDNRIGEHLRQFGGRGNVGTGSFGGKSSTENNTNNNNRINNNSFGRDEDKNGGWNSRDRSSSFGGRRNGSNNSRLQYNKGNDIGNNGINGDDKIKDNNTRQFGNAAAGGFGSRRGNGLKGRIPRPYASEWENSVVSPRNEQIQNFKNQDKFGNENLNNNGRSVSSLSSPSSLMKDSNDDIFEDSNTQNVCQSTDNKNINLEENGNVEINGKDNKINGVKKDGEKFKNKAKTNQNKEEKEEGELTDEEDFKNLSNTSTLSVCSTTSLATVRRLSQSSDKNDNLYNEAETRPASAAASHFNKYRTKPPSLASEDDEGRNTMLIRKIKLGFSIERILEDLQNFGDIIEYKQLDETTAIFKFLDASEAELAAKVVSKNSNLFGNMAIFELQR